MSQRGMPSGASVQLAFGGMLEHQSCSSFIIHVRPGWLSEP